MAENNSPNLKQTCVNCHFFAYVMENYSSKSGQYSEKVVDEFYRNFIKEKCYNYNQSTEVPEECDYSCGYNSEKMSSLPMGLKCYKNVWPVIELSMERIPRTPDIKTCAFLHTVPKYREKAFEEIVAVERKDCFFYRYKQGMSLEAAEELEKRADQNKGITMVEDKDKDTPLYKKTPVSARWQDLTMAFPNHLPNTVDIIFKGNKKDHAVSLKDLGFLYKRSTRVFKESLKLLKMFAEDKDNNLSAKGDTERNRLYAQVESLRDDLNRCFGIDKNSVRSNKEGGYRLEFRAYCYDKKGEEKLLNNLRTYLRKLKNETNETKSVHDDVIIKELKELIYVCVEKYLETNQSVSLENIICTECYEKIPLCIIDSDNLQVLCSECNQM